MRFKEKERERAGERAKRYADLQKQLADGANFEIVAHINSQVSAPPEELATRTELYNFSRPHITTHLRHSNESFKSLK